MHLAGYVRLSLPVLIQVGSIAVPKKRYFRNPAGSLKLLFFGFLVNENLRASPIKTTQKGEKNWKRCDQIAINIEFS